jgi:hypothetical protein
MIVGQSDLSQTLIHTMMPALAGPSYGSAAGTAAGKMTDGFNDSVFGGIPPLRGINV